MNLQESVAAFRRDRSRFESLGVAWQPGWETQGYLPDEYKQDYTLAMDAQPALTTTPNAGLPVWLTMLTDPQVYEILFAPTKAAEILGEVRKGTWLDQTAMFPVVEATGEVSSYGDFNENGRAGINMAFPQRQAYLFQIMKEWGELEAERFGLARINYVSQIDRAAAGNLNRYANFTYFFGVSGLQNYGLLNDPNLSAAITPATKAGGGTAWIVAGLINATANEIYADIEALWIRLVAQTAGLVNQDSRVVMALSPGSRMALTATNSFNVNVSDLLKKNFPNIRIVDAVQYGVLSATNPQGIPAGNMVQLIAEEVTSESGPQQTGYAAYNEKMRSHKIIPATSSFRQKVTAGTWGAVIRFPAAVASMIGV